MAPTTLSIDELEKPRTRSSTQKSTDGAKRNRDDSESRSSSEPKAKVSKKNHPSTDEPKERRDDSESRSSSEPKVKVSKKNLPSTDGPEQNRDEGKLRSSSEPKAKASKKNHPKTVEERSVPKVGSVSPELISALEHMSNGFLLKSDATVIRDFFHYHRYSHLVEVALP